MREATIRPLEERDLDEADRVMRVAFGTHLGAEEPVAVFGDAEFVRTRFRSNPGAAFAAELDGEIVGSNFATRWGSFGFFGPLTVRPDLWGQGIAGRLMEPVVELFDSWQVRHAGLFTFPESLKHVSLYNRFGFWPNQLNPILNKEVAAPGGSYELLSSADSSRDDLLAQCREVGGANYEGLDLSEEIRSLSEQELGEVVLLPDGDSLGGFAVCHIGAGSEAGSGGCYVKFAAVRPGNAAARRFGRLLEACESLAAELGASALIAGVNADRHGAHRVLLERGFRARMNGLTMLRPHGAAYNRPDSYVIDDLR